MSETNTPSKEATSAAESPSVDKVADSIADLAVKSSPAAKPAEGTETSETAAAPVEEKKEEPAAAKPTPDDNDEDDEAAIIARGSGLIPEEQAAELDVQQADPNSPLYSVHSFEELGLSDDLLKGVYAMKFNKPSKIQELALPVVFKNPPENLIAQAQSGTGKTACFTLGMLNRVDVANKSPQCLCITYTRELTRQNMAVLLQMGKYTGITSRLVVKDEKITSKMKEQIVLGTPGKVSEVLKKKLLDPKGIKLLVLDEADVMLDQQGLADQTIRIKKLLPANVQVLLFSATYAAKVRNFATKVVSNPTLITVKREKLSVAGIRQFYLQVKSEEEKVMTLGDIYGFLTIGSSIIFVQTRKTAHHIHQTMTADGHTVSLLHGADMDTKERDRVIDDFRLGKTKVLITTNVLARGIDIMSVTLVVNYDLPVDRAGNPDPETYLHRIGRSGRFGRKGVALNIVHDQKSRDTMDAIAKHFKKDIEPVPNNDVEGLGKVLQEQ